MIENLSDKLTMNSAGKAKQELYNELIKKFNMISNEKINNQIDVEIEELEKYKSNYKYKKRIFSQISEKVNFDISRNIQIFNKKIELIENQINCLNCLKKENDINKLLLEFKKNSDINKKIKEDFVNDSINEEEELINYITTISKELNNDINNNENNSSINDNSVLLISEIEDKVILPYTGKEVEEIIRSDKNEYKSEQEVIDNVFSRKLSEYNNLSISRFREAFNLATKNENYSKLDGIRLGFEMLFNKYLHPAIISACRTIDELDVYLDCLNKNELNDFKIFDIKYELHPVVVKQKGKHL